MFFSKNPSFFTTHYLGISGRNLLIMGIGIISCISSLYLVSHYKNYQTTLTLSEEDARSYAADIIETLKEDTKKWTVLAYPSNACIETKIGRAHDALPILSNNAYAF